MTATAVLFASTLGNLFKPLYEAMAWLIAFFYRIVPNYAFAISMLTIVVMAITAPLTVKSTKSMAAMQRLGPELKKIQQKYKGDRERLNEEMMRLYKEHGVNPAGGCLPMLLQFPVFIVLYGVIRGLTNTVTHGVVVPLQYVAGQAVHNAKCVSAVCAEPRYISQSTKLYQNLVASHGQMKAFGIDLSNKALGHHGSFASSIPYWGLVLFAIGLQYLQMRQLNSRNPQYAQANPQAAALQKYFPIIFGFIYLTIAAGVNIYFIVSSLCRIGIQEAVFRSGVLDKKPVPTEGVLPGRQGSSGPPRRRTLMDRLADAQARALEAQKSREQSLLADATDVTEERSGGNGRGGKGSASSNGGKQPTRPANAGGNGTNGSKSQGSSGKAAGAGGAPKASHPRAKGKRPRKAR
ncbi:MAG TPA: YidC/Oxa1 family membrane protein insertase [Acidimicrobiales bacterium]|nr:YidC/Oxa1 family membrane protein insertase [Acidimicrobiales bacterium]